jgi:hypothetical protein
MKKRKGRNNGMLAQAKREGGTVRDGTLCPNSASLYGRDVSQSAAWQETNDFLIRKFKLSERRLRSPMPIERHDFDRNDLAAMFGETRLHQRG